MFSRADLLLRAALSVMRPLGAARSVVHWQKFDKCTDNAFGVSDAYFGGLTVFAQTPRTKVSISHSFVPRTILK